MSPVSWCFSGTTVWHTASSTRNSRMVSADTCRVKTYPQYIPHPVFSAQGIQKEDKAYLDCNDSLLCGKRSRGKKNRGGGVRKSRLERWRWGGDVRREEGVSGKEYAGRRGRGEEGGACWAGGRRGVSGCELAGRGGDGEGRGEVHRVGGRRGSKW